MSEKIPDKRSFSVYLGKNEFEAVERLKRRYLRTSTTDLIRFLITAADTGFFDQNLVYSTKPARTKRAAANN